MRKPEPGDVIPFLADDYKASKKIKLMLVDSVEPAIEYLIDSEDFIVFGSILRRAYYEGRDPLVIDNDDEWTYVHYCVYDSDILPPMMIEYREDGGW